MAIASDTSQSASARNFWLGVVAYILPTFPIAFTWHLVLFERNYQTLQIYRADPIVPFGFASMIIQGLIFSWTFPRLFVGSNRSIIRDGVALRARRRSFILVVHNAGCRGQASIGFNLGLR